MWRIGETVFGGMPKVLKVYHSIVFSGVTVHWINGLEEQGVGDRERVIRELLLMEQQSLRPHTWEKIAPPVIALLRLKVQLSA